MGEMIAFVASVTLLKVMSQLVPPAARWIATTVRPYYYPGSMLMNLIPKLRHPFDREKRADFGFYLGWQWRDPDEASPTTA